MKTYYLILNRKVGKQEENGSYYIFRNGEWHLDSDNEIFDWLIGYDPSEPPDSPYRIGCLDILNEIEEISYEKAMELTGGIE